MRNTINNLSLILLVTVVFAIIPLAILGPSKVDLIVVSTFTEYDGSIDSNAYFVEYKTKYGTSIERLGICPRVKNNTCDDKINVLLTKLNTTKVFVGIKNSTAALLEIGEMRTWSDRTIILQSYLKQYNLIVLALFLMFLVIHLVTKPKELKHGNKTH